MAETAVSAIALAAAVRRRPAPGRPRISRLAGMAGGVRLVFASHRLRGFMFPGWLAAFYIVARALAVPYAAQLRHGPVAAGLIFAAGPLGAVGMVVFTRLVRPAVRLPWMGPMEVAARLVHQSRPKGGNDLYDPGHGRGPLAISPNRCS